MLSGIFRRSSSSSNAFANTRGESLARLAFVLISTTGCMATNYVYHLWVTVKTGILPDAGWRYVIIPIIVFVVVFNTGVRYLMHAYNLKDLKLAVSYLVAAMFGYGFPALAVRNGERVLKEGEENLVDRIGGPGFVAVRPGSVAVVETLGGASRVLGPGNHFITRQEYVKETINLEERYAKVEVANPEEELEKLRDTYLQSNPTGLKDNLAITKDGIPILVTDTRFCFRIEADESAEEDSGLLPEHPYAFSEDAVRYVVYSPLAGKDAVASWEDTIRGSIVSVITNYIARHTNDQLKTPAKAKNDPRKEIEAELKSEPVRNRLKKKGAELQWVDIGHFINPWDEIVGQRLDNWQTRWKGETEQLRTYGKSLRTTYKELGRAETQAKMLNSIVSALQSVRPEGDTGRSLRTLYLARMAQIVDALRQQMDNPEEDQSSQDTERTQNRRGQLGA
jgi:hypothetical protein